MKMAGNKRIVKVHISSHAVHLKIKLILTKSISRFARNMMECVETIRHLRELGVKVVFEKEDLDTESMGGELMLGILATIAQEESNSISQNLNWSRRQHALRGEPWERPPYGYVSVGKQHKWEAVEEQGDVVRQAFYMAGMCFKYPDIVEELNRMEREMGSERVWTHGTLMILLKNCAYIGEYLSNKEGSSECENHITFRRALFSLSLFSFELSIIPICQNEVFILEKWSKHHI